MTKSKQSEEIAYPQKVTEIVAKNKPTPSIGPEDQKACDQMLTRSYELEGSS